jgi:hypothetical protein
MGTIRAFTPSFDLEIDTRVGETALEALRRQALPAQGFLLLDNDGGFVSLTHVVDPGVTIHAIPVGNADFSQLRLGVDVAARPEAIAEIFTLASDDQAPSLVQFTRAEGIDYIYTAAMKVLDRYRAMHPGGLPIQVAFSGGADCRIIGECLGRYQSDNPDAAFHAVITANGFEDQEEHLRSAAAIADAYHIEHSIYNEQAAAKVLGFTASRTRHRNEFPHDGAEILAASWVQELNFQVAYDAGRTAIMFGFNQEDIIAERFYQALTGQQPDAYPIRRINGLDLLAPLHKIPKKLIDALDIDNALRSYRGRRPPTSQLMSSMHFLACHIVERLPALATAICDPSASADLRFGNAEGFAG